MTKPLPPVLEYLIDDVLADEEITTKRMFGGFGVYYHGTIFAGMMNGELHLKAHKFLLSLNVLNFAWFAFYPTDIEPAIHP